MQNRGSLYVYQYFSIHRTSLYVRELRLIILAFNLPFLFPFGFHFLGFQWKKSKFASCWACLLYAQLLLETRSWDSQLQRKDASHKIESIRLLHRMLVFFRRNVVCIKSGLNGSRNVTDHGTASNLSVQVNRVYCLLKQLACYPH